MSDAEVVKVEISFKDIFPTCQDNYNNYFFEREFHRSAVYSKISKACNDISVKFTPGARWNNTFYTSCDKLGYYLYKIKDKSDKDRMNYCKFFIYELKREANNKVRNIKTFDDVHNELIKAYRSEGLHGLGVCKEYISLMYDPLLLEIFKKFDELYKNFKYLKINNNKNTYAEKCVYKYDEISRTKKNVHENFVQKELDIFKREFHKYKQRNPYECDDNLLSRSLMIPPKSMINANALLRDIDSPVTWTSAGVLFFYTAYGSYLRPRRRMLKDMQYRKAKKHYELMNSFEQSQKNIIKNKHDILYNTAE
ncbi:variable surface protein [Plasmodium gonderi]|uniref:Variable surface protein n=1 Tax=Plasmodium gonderi TaxID=77519 RepID=A0A1Y1JX02_PLAGO|nr:variable surface protein [Plasmodium gonderi]GAW84344.1 variable surface protein [Plasmodium gonderi]